MKQVRAGDLAGAFPRLAGRLGKHVLVTVPEHRLSMENKAIELAWKGDAKESQALHQALDFLRAHGRDILDESDETLAFHWFPAADLRILHAKYQLIYTLGSPVALDGGAMRWRVAAAVLASVSRHALELAAAWPQAMQPLGDVVAHEFPKGLRHPAFD